jgi:tripartite-type tricarboxylate transporter receptor subunit TctC
MNSRRRFLAGLGGLAALPVLPALAQQYPNRPLRLIVPFSPGGTTDIVGRVIAQYLGERLGQTVVVDNRPGAGSIIGLEAAARAAPDGYTLLLGSVDNFCILPATRRTLPFDTVRDFTPLVLMTTVANLFAVHPSVPAKSIAELRELARAKSGAIRYSTAGIGTILHMQGEMLRLRAGIDIVHVPYKGGGDAITAAVGGQVEMVSTGVASAGRQIAAGQLRALAVTSETRSAAMPEVPTMIESGYPDFLSASWFGIFTQAAVPADVGPRLASELLAVTQLPAFQKRIAELGGGGRQLAREQFAQFIQRDLARWQEVVAKAQIKLD